MQMRISSVLYIAFIMALIFYIGCRNDDAPPTQPKPNVLRLSMIPATDPNRVMRESQPLVAYLEKQVGMRVELTVPTNYATVAEAMVKDQIDIAYLDGFNYIQAASRAGVQPLVQREPDQNSHSIFITQPGSGINNLGDLKGKAFSFGDINSSSGHLMSRYFLREAQVDPGTFSSVAYSGSHDATAMAVVDKKVDAGVLDEAALEKLLQDGKINQKQIKIIYKSPPFPDHVWAARKTLDAKLAETFANALLNLNPNDAEQKSILDLLSTSKFVKANDADYDKLRQATKDAGLLQ